MKVRQDFTYHFPNAASSFNALLVGAAQSANLLGWGYGEGHAVSVQDTALDQTGATSLRQWFNFYQRYVVHASKVKVYLFPSNDGAVSYFPTAITLVPTIDWHLLNPQITGSPTFDAADIEPGELPYAKKMLISSVTQSVGLKGSVMSSYLSVKKMLNIKDLNDVAQNRATVADSVASKPFVPFIPDWTLATNPNIQPFSGSAQAGIYWNIVFQNAAQNALIPPATQHPGFTVRIVQTSYIEFSDRVPLQT